MIQMSFSLKFQNFCSDAPSNRIRSKYYYIRQLKYISFSPHRALVVSPLDALYNRSPVQRIFPLLQQYWNRLSVEMHCIIQICSFCSYLKNLSFALFKRYGVKWNTYPFSDTEVSQWIGEIERRTFHIRIH